MPRRGVAAGLRSDRQWDRTKPTSAKVHQRDDENGRQENEVVDFDGIKDRIVHYCIDNEIPYKSSMPLDALKDAQGKSDDLKSIKAFNDDKALLVFTPKTPIPADAVTASAGLDRHIVQAMPAVQSGPRCEGSRSVGEQVVG